MKRILIISPPMVSSPILFERAPFISPYAALRLGAYLKAQGHDVSVIDCLEPPAKGLPVPECLGYGDAARARLRFYGIPPDRLRESLVDYGDLSEIWVTGGLTYSWRVFHHVIDVCREMHPRALLRFGGIYPTLCPEMARTSLADDVFIGELPEADGYLPDYSLVRDQSRYTFVVNTTKGCPNRCSYCAVGLLEKHLRFYEPARIVDFVQANCDRYGFREVHFNDNNILFNSRKHFESILDLLVERRVNVEIPRLEQGLQTDLVYPEVLDKLLGVGFVEMSLALESTVAAERVRFRRPDQISHVHRAIDMGLDRGLKVVLKILCGMPGQTMENILNAIEFARRYGCMPDLQSFAAVPRTEEYERCLALRPGLGLEDLEPLGWPFAHDGMRRADLDALFCDTNRRSLAVPARNPPHPNASVQLDSCCPHRENIAFFAHSRYEKSSQGGIDQDHRYFFAGACNVVETPYFISPDRTLHDLVRQRARWAVLNDLFDPYGLVARRNEERVDLGFILCPYTLEPWRRRFARLSYVLTSRDIVLAFNSHVEDGFRLLGTKAQILSMPIPVDCRRFSPSYRHSDITVVYYGRPTPDGGLIETLHAIAGVESIAKINVICPLSGLSRDEELYLAAVKDLASQPTLRERTVFHCSLLHNQIRKREVLCESDLLISVTTSQDDAVARVVVEAFAAGLAVIATDWPGVNELVENGHNGFLVNPERSTLVSEITTAIHRLCESNTLLDIRRENRRRSFQFDYRSKMSALNKLLLAPSPCAKQTVTKEARREHAILVRDCRDLKYMPGRKLERIYFGNDFCEYQMPTTADIEEILAVVEHAGCEFTLVLPWCTDTDIARLDDILAMVPKTTEVVFNDWGALELLRAQGLVPVMGRLLVSITRDPRRDACLEHLEAARLCNLDDTAFQQLLVDRGVFRVELDNVLQGYHFAPIPGLHFSLHYPFVNVAVTRKCPFACHGPSGVCNCACADDDALGRLDGSDTLVIIKGNGQFYRNDRQSDDLTYRGIDRIVYTPKLPYAGLRPGG